MWDQDGAYMAATCAPYQDTGRLNGGEEGSERRWERTIWAHGYSWDGYGLQAGI